MLSNDLERLRNQIQERFPEGAYKLLESSTQTGSWWLDVSANGCWLTIEWRPGRGFGLSTPHEGDAFLGADEVYEDVDAAYARARALLLSQTPTRPPLRARLPELREARKLSQAELASRLSINQGACSRMERRSDMLIGTLRNVVEALGGELYLMARFPDETVYIDLQGTETRETSHVPESSAA
ncbi:MAG TPA: XRE family transcriptional regulator [Longimicrobium sp.]|nr:XRE family transcriptional regulator [Longimicrobium sp.]